MNYIVFDLELNQEYNFKKLKKDITAVTCPFEIIQIGALKLNKNFNTISTFNKLIKPEIYKDINPYVEEITGINREILSGESSFMEVYEEFKRFIGDNKSIFCIWGSSDMRELFRNIQYYGLDSTLIPNEYINVQAYASKYFNYPKGINIGLSNAVEALNLPCENQFHDAFNDAYYTAEIFKTLYSKDMKPKKYSLDSHKKKSTPKKENINTDSLFKQFEKMYNREITDEEKSMIKLAYIMGKTNQF